MTGGEPIPEETMKAADVMTRRLITIDPDSSVADAAKRMLENRISGMPVLDEQGRLIGLISEGDLLRRSEMGTHQRQRRSWWLTLLSGPTGAADDYVKSHSRRVRDVMTQSVVSVSPDASLNDIVNVLERHRIKRVPVLDNGKLVGIVSRANLLQALASAAEVHEPSADDRTLRDRVLAELASQPWAPDYTENIVVKDGIVHLWGSVSTESQHHALLVAAESVPGVRGVEDHVTVVDQFAGGAGGL
jgi:CBS domain-containing protein